MHEKKWEIGWWEDKKKLVNNEKKKKKRRKICKSQIIFISLYVWKREKLQQPSLGFMKVIITFCDKTITKLKAEIENAEKNLKTILENSTFQEVQNTINPNQNIGNRSLKQRKLKKFNNLKYGLRQTQQYPSRDKESTREDETTENFVRSTCEER